MGCSILGLATAVVTLGGLVFGYELGIISGALMQLQTHFHLSCIQQETVVSALVIGAVFATLVGGWLIDHYGRRTSILLSIFLIVVGSLFLIASNSFLMIVIGRLLVGFAICISSMSCCIFVSEMVSPNSRGLMVSLYEAGVTVGVLLAYAVNYILSGTLEGWRYMFGFAILPSLTQLVSIWVLPSQHMTLVSLVSEGQSQMEQSDGAIEEISNQAQTSKQYTILHLFQHKDNMHTRTVIGLGLVLFQQFTGQPNVLFYASTIFHSVGFKNYASAVLASVGLGIVKVIATLLAMFCADKVGRRPLLISGCLVMATGLMLIGFLSRNSAFDSAAYCSPKPYTNSTLLPEKPMDLRIIRNHTTDTGHSDMPTVPQAVGMFNWLILICMMSVVSAFSVGFGPMTWLILSEIFPVEVRGRAFAFTNCFNWVANLIVTFSFLNVIDVMGLSGTFFAYGVISVAAAVFIYFLLPETKGKSLQEIDKELCERRVPYREEFGNIFHRRFSSGYQRVSWRNVSI